MATMSVIHFIEINLSTYRNLDSFSSSDSPYFPPSRYKYAVPKIDPQFFEDLWKMEGFKIRSIRERFNYFD